MYLMYTKKTGEQYILPYNIKSMISNKFIINRCDDIGPLTKLEPILMNNKISDNSPILICDDDIHYKKK